jgi:membrane protease YdiL (CAAX protease family)
MPGKLMNCAGVVVALIFALLHATNFNLRAWPIALGQQIYAFIVGVLYAYWREKSKSIVAPIIGHNVSDGVEYAIEAPEGALLTQDACLVLRHTQI